MIHTKPIEVLGKAGESVTITIKALAVKTFWMPSNIIPIREPIAIFFRKKSLQNIHLVPCGINFD